LQGRNIASTFSSNKGLAPIEIFSWSISLDTK
jgi:hypothetical protein